MTIKNNTTKIITTFHSESTVHSNDINISYCEKTPKIGENPFIIDLAFHQNFSILTVLRLVRYFELFYALEALRFVNEKLVLTSSYVYSTITGNQFSQYKMYVVTAEVHVVWVGFSFMDIKE